MKMRRVFLILLLAGIATTAHAQSGAPPLEPRPVPTTAAPGERVSVAVYAGTAEAPVNGLFGVSFAVAYDDAVFSLTEATEGSLMRQGLAEEATVLTFGDLVGQQPAPFSVSRVRPQPGVDGHGPVAVFDVSVAPDAPNGTYAFTLSDVQAVDPDGDAVALAPVAGTVTVSDAPVNTAPSAGDDAATTPEDTAVAIDVLANDADPDGDALSVTAASDPAHGTAAVDGDAVTYTPEADFHGTDTFTYTVDDGNGATAQAAVTVTVEPVNDAPAFTSPAVTDATQDQAYAYAVAATDVDGDALSLTAPTLPAWLAFQDAGDGTATLGGTPADAHVGDHEVVLQADDGTATVTQTFTVSVANVNDAPVVVATPADVSTTAGAAPVEVDLSGVFDDPDGDPLTFAAASTDASVADVLVDGAALTVTPVSAGTAAIDVTAEDGSGATATARFTVAVTANDGGDVNAAPSAGDDAATTPEDTAVAIDVLANDADPDGDALSVTAASDPAHGTAAVDGDAVTYTPETDFHGIDTFTYTVDDGNGATAQATVTVTVEPVNDAPVVTAVPADVSRALADGPADVDLAGTFDDPDGDPLTYTVASSDEAVATAGISGATLTLTPHAAGTTAITVTAEDGQGETATTAFEMTVTATSGGDGNDPPVAADDAAETVAGVPVDVDVLDNDADPDGDDLAIATVSRPAAGTAAIHGGTVTYTPETDFDGVDAFTYIVVDGSGGSARGTVRVTVERRADLRATASFTPHAVGPGEALTLTLSVTNEGPSAAADVVLAADLPASSTVDGVSAGCTYDDDALSCSVGTLDAGASAGVSVALTAPDASAVLAATATAASSTPDPAPGNETAAAKATVEADLDGVTDEVEDGAPNDGDGNDDGIPDSNQEHVASLPTDDGDYVTIAAPAGTRLTQVTTREKPAPDEAPDDVVFPLGVIGFGLTGADAATETTVTLFVPPGEEVTSYWKYGPTPENAAPHWYEFLYDGRTGAEILGDRIVLHFVDGARGDADLTVDGTITDPGAPVFQTDDTPTSTGGRRGLPDGFVLQPNYPNPFNPETTIAYELPEAAYVTVRVFDALGREVTTLVEARQGAGRHEVVFRTGDLPSGIYVYRMSAGGFTETRRMVLLK